MSSGEGRSYTIGSWKHHTSYIHEYYTLYQEHQEDPPHIKVGLGAIHHPYMNIILSTKKTPLTSK